MVTTANIFWEEDLLAAQILSQSLQIPSKRIKLPHMWQESEKSGGIGNIPMRGDKLVPEGQTRTLSWNQWSGPIKALAPGSTTARSVSKIVILTQ